MFLHVLADTLGSVGVIFSSLLIRYFGWTWADPVCSMFIAVLITASTWPLLRDAGEILLLRAPRSLDFQLPSALLELTNIEGVVGYSQAKFWQISHGKNTGCIRILTRPDCYDQEVKKRVLNHFYKVGLTDVLVQIDKEVMQI